MVFSAVQRVCVEWFF